jgi:hypothetical protein
MISLHLKLKSKGQTMTREKAPRQCKDSSFRSFAQFNPQKLSKAMQALTRSLVENQLRDRAPVR